MADDWRDILSGAQSKPAAQAGSAPKPPADDWRAVLGAPASSPDSTPDSGEGSWWDRHGRTVEAAGAGLALLIGGPKIAKGLGTALTKAGPAGEAALQGGRNVQATLAPSTVDEAAGRAAGAIRGETGTAARRVAETQARLEPLWKGVGGLDDIGKRNFIGYVEGRSKGVKLLKPELQPLADELRDAYASVHKDMGALDQTQKIGWIEDYYRHQWVKDPTHANVFSKEGLGYFTKERSLPTIEDGLARGLVPRTLDPVQTTLEYVANARRFIASNRILDVGRSNGDVFYKKLGYKGPFPTNDRWVPLDGALTRKGAGQLYAKENWARVYNNFVSSGFTGPAGEIVNGLRRASNTVTAFELGMSGFHVTTMANEAVINDVAKAVTSLAGGNAKQAIADLIKAPTAPYRLFQSGKKLEKVYLGQAGGTPEERKLANLLTRAGGRGAGMAHAKDYEYTSMGSFLQSWKRASGQAERLKYAQDIKANPFVGVPKTMFSLIGRTMQSVSEPLFKYYIPRIKNGAFADNMSQWLRTHPGAQVAEQEAAARQIWDSIDNRFGELVQDNVFWKQHMKQLSMIAMRSYSWNMGTIREIGGGVKDIASHQFTPRAAYVIALPIVYGTLSAVYQVLKTGGKPQDIQDLLAPRTGGTDAKSGMPERMMMPGYMKDVFAWSEDPVKAASNKMSTFLGTGLNMVTGKDWKGDPIAPPPDDPNAPFERTVPPWLQAYFGLAAQNMTPISVRDLSKGKPEGSNISGVESFMGLHSANRKMTDPEGYESMKRYQAKKAYRKKERYDQKQQNQSTIE